MKRLFISALILGSTIVGSQALAQNGAPNGAHYNLNIIGVPKGKTADMTGSSGRTIFVWDSGTSRINLSEGATYQVLDRNGTDANGATFQLPNPDPDGDGITLYSVYSRALGKPGGMSTTTMCLEDKATLEIYCSTESLVSVRSGGKSTFTNVSKTLLTYYGDIDGDGTMNRIGLFSNDAYSYFWDYVNNGLKLLQLRFYEIPTNVN